MVSQDKLIKMGITYTDKLFEEIIRRLEQGIRASDTLEEFLAKTSEYTTSNPLSTTDYDATMLNLILAATNNYKFSRPAQKELVRVTIENYVGDLIRDVGEDVKESVRDIVKEGYDNNLSQDEIAENISQKVKGIKNKRARAIARTEIARAATVSDYVINKERGATDYTVDCRNTACDKCRKEYLTNPDIEVSTRGIDGDIMYPIDDTSHLPPLHPNCRCVAMFHNNSERAKYIRSQIHVKTNS